MTARLRSANSDCPTRPEISREILRGGWAKVGADYTRRRPLRQPGGNAAQVRLRRTRLPRPDLGRVAARLSEWLHSPRPAMPPRPRPSRRAFTLVELVVVIGIISVLMAILLPSLNKARDSARKVRCASNLRSQGQLVHLYAVDNAGSYPISPGTGGAAPAPPPTGLNGVPLSTKFPFGDLGWGTQTNTIDNRMAVPAGQALLYDGGYLEQPEDLLYCPALNPQLTYAENWKYDPIANPTWKETYINYCWWIGFNPPGSNVLVGPDEVVGAGPNGEPGTAQWTDFWPRNQASPADRVMISELSSQSGPLADKGGPDDTRLKRPWAFVNHVDPASPNGRPLGGNVMTNDGACRWVPFGEQRWRVNQLNAPIFLSLYY